MSNNFGRPVPGQQMRTRVRDAQGHYERWPETRVHPDLDTAVRTFLADPSCEFSTISDLIRGCVLHALPQFKTSNPNTKSILAIFKAVEEENSRSQMRRRFKQHIEETAREAFELVGEGRTGEAAKHVHRVLLHVRDMDPEDPWRAEFEKALKDKFGHLLRMTQGASLVPEIPEVTENLVWLTGRGRDN